MAGSVNKVILVGNVGRDPEIRTMSNGNRVANLSLATSETWKDKETGERRERTEWHRIVAFSEGLVRVIENYVHKGTPLYIEGQLQTRKWEDQQGQERYTTEVVLQGYRSDLRLLGRAGDSQGSYGRNQGAEDAGISTGGAASGPGGQGIDDKPIDDDIPF